MSGSIKNSVNWKRWIVHSIDIVRWLLCLASSWNGVSKQDIAIVFDVHASAIVLCQPLLLTEKFPGIFSLTFTCTYLYFHFGLSNTVVFYLPSPPTTTSIWFVSPGMYFYSASCACVSVRAPCASVCFAAKLYQQLFYKLNTIACYC